MRMTSLASCGGNTSTTYWRQDLYKLDANSIFWQISLSPQSALLTTFIAPYDRFTFADYHSASHKDQSS